MESIIFFVQLNNFKHFFLKLKHEELILFKRSNAFQKILYPMKLFN